jgi:CRISPR/Cas system-associated protein Cas10 (large subunit of type III CRISPR-Cas system)
VTILIEELGEAYDGTESQLDRFIAATHGRECDLCGGLFVTRGGPHDGGEDGQLCDVCKEASSTSKASSI